VHVSMQAHKSVHVSMQAHKSVHVSMQAHKSVHVSMQAHKSVRSEQAVMPWWLASYSTDELWRRYTVLNAEASPLSYTMWIAMIADCVGSPFSNG